MSLKKEIKKVFAKLKKAKVKKKEAPVQYVIPPEVVLTNIVTEADFEQNRIFIEKMRRHTFREPPKSFLCFLPYAQPQFGFISGGYGTIMALNDALSRIFKAKIYLCFFPAVADKVLENEFVQAAKKAYPYMEFSVVGYDEAFSLQVDVALCNFWLGAYPLLKFNNCKEKYNLIQDHEAMFYNGTVACLAEQTLSFGFYKLCNSQVLKDYVAFVDAKAPAFRYFPGIDHQLYYALPPADKDSRVCKIIFYGRPSVPRNAFSFLVPVLQKVKRELGEQVQIISVGEDYDVAACQLEGVVENCGRLESLEKLADLYRQCHIGISLITTPTFSYQHLEFMASGLCLVTNRQSGIQDFLTDKENAVVCEMSVDIMAGRIIDLVKHPSEIQKIAVKAVETTDLLDWDTCYQGIADYIMSDKRENG